MEALYIGYAAAFVFMCLPGIYWLTAPDWSKTPLGRVFMMLLACLAAAFVLISTSGLFGAYPGREAVRYLLYSALLIAGSRLAYTLIQLRFGKAPATWVEDRDTH